MSKEQVLRLKDDLIETCHELHELAVEHKGNIYGKKH